MVDGLMVINVKSVNFDKALSSGIIITVADNNAQKDIVDNLNRLSIKDYIIF
jgi:hypothetical protein